MRGLAKLYMYACEEMGCVSNSELTRYFTSLDYMDDIEAAYPTRLDLRNNYLGDAGAAACFRVLPHMLWVRCVEAANIGCGPLGVKALCEVLALRTAPAPRAKAGLTCIHPSALEAQASPATASMAVAEEDDQAKQEDNGSALAVVPLEYIDLSGNPIFAHTADELLKALRLRRDWIRLCYGSGVGDAPTPPPLQLVLDWAILPKRTATRLQSLCSSAPEGCLLSNSHKPHQPGPSFEERNHSIYRILISEHPNDGDGDPYHTPYDAANPFLAAFVQQINEHIRDYLLTFHHIKPCSDNNELVDSVTPAVAYLCVEYGADLLSRLFTQSQCATGGIPAIFFGTSLSCGEGMICNRIVGRARTLLQALNATPQLLQEALARDRDGPLLRYYLERLRASLRQVTPPPGASSSHSIPSEFPQDLEVLYHRVASSLVCRKMEWTLLPAIEASETRIDEIKQYMIEYLLDGKLPSNIYKHKHQNHGETSNEVLPCGALTRWCAQAMYHIHNEPKSHAEWNRAYQCMAHRLFKAYPSCSPDINEGCISFDSLSHDLEETTARRGVEEEYNTANSFTHSCSDVKHAPTTPCVQAGKEEGMSSMQLPSSEHSCVALRTVYEVLKDPYTIKRLEVVAQLQKALPIEMRHFLADLLICQNSRGCAGGPYVAPLFGEPSSLESFMMSHREEDARFEVTNSELKVGDSFRMIGWSLVDILAVLYNRKDRLMELLKAFTEWHRLRTIESLASHV